MESNSEKFSSVNSTGLLNTHEDYSDQKHEATQKTRSGNTVMLEKFAKDVIENEDPIIDFQIDFLRQAAENEGKLKQKLLFRLFGFPIVIARLKSSSYLYF